MSDGTIYCEYLNSIKNYYYILYEGYKDKSGKVREKKILLWTKSKTKEGAINKFKKENSDYVLYTDMINDGYRWIKLIIKLQGYQNE